jgi:hypothetical protein
VIDRRRFVGNASGAAALLAAACAGATPAATAAAPSAARGRWDDSWTTRLGRHRVVFDVAELDAQPGAGQVAPVMDAYHDVLGTTDAELGFVLVIRHQAVSMLFQDRVWEKYDVGADLTRQDPKTRAPYRRNPFAPMLSSLQQRGVTILGCNSAAQGIGAILAQRAKADVAATRTEVLAALLPGVTLLPNGLYALARAQDVGCGFMR